MLLAFLAIGPVFVTVAGFALLSAGIRLARTEENKIFSRICYLLATVSIFVLASLCYIVMHFS